jgi:chorismate synthase
MKESRPKTDLLVIIPREGEPRVIGKIPPGHQEISLWDRHNQRDIRIVVHQSNRQLLDALWCDAAVRSFLKVEDIHIENLEHRARCAEIARIGK